MIKLCTNSFNYQIKQIPNCAGTLIACLNKKFLNTPDVSEQINPELISGKQPKIVKEEKPSNPLPH
jgi:hypothetical protein